MSRKCRIFCNGNNSGGKLNRNVSVERGMCRPEIIFEECVGKMYPCKKYQEIIVARRCAQSAWHRYSVPRPPPLIAVLVSDCVLVHVTRQCVSVVCISMRLNTFIYNRFPSRRARHTTATPSYTVTMI